MLAAYLFPSYRIFPLAQSYHLQTMPLYPLEKKDSIARRLSQLPTQMNVLSSRMAEGFCFGW
jgi:hypothetical protein